MPATEGPDTLNGTANPDTINGLGGDDTIYGFGANDLLDGGEGDDWIEGGAGADTLWGGGGNDLIFGAEFGGTGDLGDFISGDGGNDALSSGAGENTIHGGVGNDSLRLDEGAVMKAGLTLGGADEDIFFLHGDVSVAMPVLSAAELECEKIQFRDSGVALRGDGTRNVIDLSGFVLIDSGEDVTLSGGGGDDRITGTAVSESIFGDGGSDLLKGAGGDDTIVGGGGTDTVMGGDGHDDINLVSTQGVASGGAGDDWIYGDSAADSFNGGAGNDSIYGRGGLDSIDAGAGNDQVTVAPVSAGGGAAVLLGGKGADQLTIGGEMQFSMLEFSAATSGFEVLISEPGLVLSATANDDLFDFSGFTVAGVSLLVKAGAGADTLIGTSVPDEFLGEAGNDRLEGREGGDTLDGGRGADALFGGGDDDLMRGGFHDDRLFGADGADTLVGGGGGDLLSGGGGADRFVYDVTYDSLAIAMDRVLDFNLTDGDLIDLSAIDADVYTAADQAFTVVSAFTEEAGQAVLAFNATKGWTRVTLDVNGDAIADFEMRVDGELTAAGLAL